VTNRCTHIGKQKASRLKSHGPVRKGIKEWLMQSVRTAHPACEQTGLVFSVNIIILFGKACRPDWAWYAFYVISSSSCRGGGVGRNQCRFLGSAASKEDSLAHPRTRKTTFCGNHPLMIWRADSSVSKVSDSGSVGPGFDSRPRLELFVQPLASCFTLMCTQSTQL